MKIHFTFKKIIFLFIFIFIPFVSCSYYILFQGDHMLKQKDLRSIQSETEMIADTLSTSMKQIHSASAEIASQSNLRKLANINYLMSTYEITASLLQLQEQQTSTKNANGFIENIIIYYKTLRKAYNSSGNEMPSFFEFDQEEYNTFAELYSSGKNFIYYDHHISEIISPTKDPLYLVRTDVSEKALEAYFNQKLSQYNNYYIFTALQKDYSLSNTSNSLYNAAISLEYDESDSPQKITVDNNTYYYFSAPVSYLDGNITYFISEEELFSSMNLYKGLNYVFLVITLISVVIFLLGSYSLIHKPFSVLINAFQDIKKQDYSVRINAKRQSEFFYLYQEFNHMAKELAELIDKNYNQKLLLNQAELKQLQAQINPHFLYNSFFLLNRMLQYELYEEAERMTSYLGVYFQYITRNSQENVPLSKDYEHAKLYCEIQALRFEGRIEIKTDLLPEEWGNILVPKLTIQPIIENAFNYGLQSKINDGILTIRLYKTEQALQIRIEDNGEDLTPEKLNEIQDNLSNALLDKSIDEMTGILNIQRRLVIYSNAKSFLEASRSSLGGLCIMINLSTTM